MLEKFKHKIKKEHIIIAVSLLALILIVFSSFKLTGGEGFENQTQSYVLMLEEKLTKSIERLEGVKSATVIIQVNEGIKTVIAEDVKEIDENGKKTTITTPVFVGGEPVILGEIYPAVTGVVVLCSCSDQLTVRLSVLDVVTTMLGISCDKVRILTQ